MTLKNPFDLIYLCLLCLRRTWQTLCLEVDCNNRSKLRKSSKIHSLVQHLFMSKLEKEFFFFCSFILLSFIFFCCFNTGRCELRQKANKEEGQLPIPGSCLNSLERSLILLCSVSLNDLLPFLRKNSDCWLCISCKSKSDCLKCSSNDSKKFCSCTWFCNIDFKVFESNEELKEEHQFNEQKQENWKQSQNKEEEADEKEEDDEEEEGDEEDHFHLLC